MKRAGNTVILAVILASIVFLSGCVPKLSAEEMLKNPNAAMDACKQVSGENQINCYLKISEVLNSSNPDAAFQACSATPDKEVNEGRNNIQKDCIWNLLYYQDTSDLKLNICKKITRSDWKGDCLEETANGEKDQDKASAICNEIDNLNLRNHCYGGIRANSQNNLNPDVELSICDSSTGADQSNCYRNLAEKALTANFSKAVEICNKISSQSDKDNCLENFLQNPEIVKANPDIAISICGSVSLKSRCYNDVARTLSAVDQKKAAGVCQFLGDDIQISDCYGTVWFFSNDIVIKDYDFTIGLCNTLMLKRDDCLKRAAGIFNSVDKDKASAICKMVSASNSQDCLNQISR